MRYNCADVKNILESNIDADPDLLEYHLQYCESCSRLVALDSEIEMELRYLLPSSAPQSIYGGVMEAISATNESPADLPSRAKWFIPTIAAVLSAIPLALNYQLLEKYLSLICAKFMNALSNLSFDLIKPVISTISGEIINASSSPFLLPALLATAFIIWFFSLSSLEKATR